MNGLSYFTGGKKMTQAKPVVNNQYPNQKSFGEKLVSILRQPLFTFTFSLPEVKTLETTESIKTVESKKTIEKKHVNRSPSIEVSSKPQTKKNAVLERQSKTAIFTPVRNHEEFGKIKFVLRACDKNLGRDFTKVLHVERTENGSRLVATDGKRMHVAEIRVRIKPGNYKPDVTKDYIRLGMPVPNVNFPDWKRVVPVITAVCGSINLENASVRGIKQIHESFEKQTGEKVNSDYLADLTKKLWVVHRQKENRKALLLKESGSRLVTYAVIMPLMS
jgi:hypothetical protein